jgi:hypothetical protein
MLSKPDYGRYFEGIACWERRKIYHVAEILSDLEDAYLGRVIKGLGGDAMRRYGLVLDILQSGVFSDAGADKRLVNRRSALGHVRLSFKESGKSREIQAYCVNLSHQGLCFESEHPVVVGVPYEALISLFDGSEPVRCVGKVTWVKEPLPGYFAAGMQFAI